MLYQSGDVLLFWGRGFVSNVIMAKTATLDAMFLKGVSWPPSHAAIVVDYGRPVLLESTMLGTHPCLVAKRPVAGVQLQDIDQRIADYGGRCEIWRADGISQNVNRVVNADVLSLLGTESTPNAKYDTIGAVISGTRAKLMPFETGSHDRWFCSELVSFVLSRAGCLNVRQPDKVAPSDLRRLLKRDFYVVPRKS